MISNLIYCVDTVFRKIWEQHIVAFKPIFNTFIQSAGPPQSKVSQFSDTEGPILRPVQSDAKHDVS